MQITPFYGCGCLDENSYIITDEASGKSAVVDPCFINVRIEDITENFNVDLILLTHCHYDHILSAEALRKLTKAKIYIHMLDFDAAADPAINLSYMFGEEIHLVCDERLEEGTTLTLGATAISVLHTPGHTSGSCCFISEDAIFSGDTLFAQSVGRTDFPTGSGGEMMNSIRKLMSLTGDYRVFCGHGAATTLADERKGNPYFF